MNMEQVKEIANAVLYEGYLLYPYRHSALKNRRRWTFGVVYPREYSEANGSVEPWMMQTECLVTGHADTTLAIHVRFLHLLVRTVTKPEVREGDRVGAPSLGDLLQVGFLSAETTETTETLETLETNVVPQGHPAWGEGNLLAGTLLASRLANEPLEEGVERDVTVEGLSLDNLVAHPRHVVITFPGGRIVEHAEDGSATEIVREQQAITGAVIIAAEPVDTNLFKLRVQIENTTAETSTVTSWHDAILLQSFVSTHTILHVHQGDFISLLEPPDALQTLAQGCQNIRTWPVLVGNKGECDAMLSSPIILYDYPEIAPESPGALFDGTEIDEILTLRIMTLTDEEKEEMRRGDERAREILERTESLSPEQFMNLHGVIRYLGPVDEGGGA